MLKVLRSVDNLVEWGEAMGGFGSGRHWFSKKRTVEECLTLDVNKLVKGELLDKSFAEVRWYREGKQIYAVGYTLEERESVLTVYDPVAQDVPLVTTRLHSGGKRYWFLCPSCRRRVGRLYLPHGKNYFLCRRCYNLTYRSCQESHAFDWFFLKADIPLRWGRGSLKRSRRDMVPSPIYGGE